MLRFCSVLFVLLLFLNKSAYGRFQDTSRRSDLIYYFFFKNVIHFHEKKININFLDGYMNQMKPKKMLIVMTQNFAMQLQMIAITVSNQLMEIEISVLK